MVALVVDFGFANRASGMRDDGPEVRAFAK